MFKTWLESIQPLRCCAMCMREKSRFRVDFFDEISITLSVSSSGLQVTVLGRFNA